MSHADNSGLSPRYGAVAQAFHWIMAIVVLVAFIYGPGGNEQRVYSAARDFDRQLHETLGLTVFVLAFLRLAWRAVSTQPDPPAIPRWMDWASKLVQGLLYVLLLVLPVTAISGAWLEGHPLTLWGGVEIAPWIGKNHDLGAQLAKIHGWLGDTIMWLAGAHALAAIFHHLFLKDGVLVSMLPRWVPLRAPKRT
ncbi:MAG TPA: cytochrome b/b6 domain-containing protein [Usitatibacter sp.]|jgi:cytochrome b561|nr:cytochrome b/b6 domain-containing protein [Usitatibacter sp.]